MQKARDFVKIDMGGGGARVLKKWSRSTSATLPFRFIIILSYPFSMMMMLWLLLGLTSAVYGDANCDLVCIKDAYEEFYNENHFLLLPSEHSKYFGKRSQLKLQRLTTYMGLVKAMDQHLTDLTFELSKNNMQLRLIGNCSNSVAQEQYNLPENQIGTIRMEYIYTLEEQGYIANATSAILLPESNSAPDITVEAAANIGREVNGQNPIVFPRFLRFLRRFSVFQLGVVGASRTHISGNTALRQYGATHIGFKHKIQFGKYTDFLRNENLKKPQIEYFLKVRLPPGQSGPVNCALIIQRDARRVCFRVFRIAAFKILHERVKDMWVPHFLVGLEIGYGENLFSQAYNTLVKGVMVSFITNNIVVAPNLEMTEASCGIRLAPLGNLLTFELKGKVEISLFGELFQLKAKVYFPLTGGTGLKLYQKGMTRLLWILPIWLGNIKAQGSILPSIVPLQGALGAEINIGWDPKDGPDTRLKGMGMVQFRKLSSFIYLKLSPITIQSLINMFVGHERWSLPKMIADTGIRGLENRQGKLKRKVFWFNTERKRHILRPREFAENPDQFLIVLAPFMLQVEHVRGLDNSPIIQPGLTVIGQVNILGVASNLYVRVDPLHLGLELDISLEPLSLGNGLVKLTSPEIPYDKNILDFMQTRGPRIYTGFDIIPGKGRKVKAPEFRISAALEVFGARIGIDVELSRNGFHVKAELNVWDWFIAKCIIRVKSHHKGLSNGVRVYGELTVESLARLTNGFFKKVLKKMKFSKWKRPAALKRFFKKQKTKLKRWRNILRPITHVKLLRVKFDLNNIELSQRSITEFEITLFGVHVIKIKSKKQSIFFGRSLSANEEEQMALELLNNAQESILVESGSDTRNRGDTMSTEDLTTSDVGEPSEPVIEDGSDEYPTAVILEQSEVDNSNRRDTTEDLTSSDDAESMVHVPDLQNSKDEGPIESYSDDSSTAEQLEADILDNDRPEDRTTSEDGDSLASISAPDQKNNTEES